MSLFVKYKCQSAEGSFKGTFSVRCQYAALFTQYSEKEKIQYLLPRRVLPEIKKLAWYVCECVCV